MQKSKGTENKYPTSPISGNPLVLKFIKEQGQTSILLQERKSRRRTQILRPKTPPVSSVRCFQFHPFKKQGKLS